MKKRRNALQRMTFADGQLRRSSGACRECLRSRTSRQMIPFQAEPNRPQRRNDRDTRLSGDDGRMAMVGGFGEREVMVTRPTRSGTSRRGCRAGDCESMLSMLAPNEECPEAPLALARREPASPAARSTRWRYWCRHEPRARPGTTSCRSAAASCFHREHRVVVVADQSRSLVRPGDDLGREVAIERAASVASSAEDCAAGRVAKRPKQQARVHGRSGQPVVEVRGRSASGEATGACAATDRRARRIAAARRRRSRRSDR